jgi:hypothetical protein
MKFRDRSSDACGVWTAACDFSELDPGNSSPLCDTVISKFVIDDSTCWNAVFKRLVGFVVSAEQIRVDSEITTPEIIFHLLISDHEKDVLLHFIDFCLILRSLSPTNRSLEIISVLRRSFGLFTVITQGSIISGPANI